MNRLPDTTHYECERCGESFETTARPVLTPADAPDEPCMLGGFTRCPGCAFDYGQPDDDSEELARISQRLGISRGTGQYLAFFDGEELSATFRGFQAELVLVRLADARHLLRPGAYPEWIGNYPRTSGPGVPIRTRLYRPNRPAHLVGWFDRQKRRVRWAERNIDLGTGGEADQLRSLLRRITGEVRAGRPRGSAKHWRDADGFRAVVGPVIRALGGREARRAAVAEHLDMTVKTLINGAHMAGYADWSDCSGDLAG